jgi:Uma2 family endonuclease
MDTEKESSVSEAQVDYNRKYTYADYVKWDDDVRYELIDGIPIRMDAPTWQHQEVLGNLFVQFHSFLKGKQCKVFLAPFDVRLNADTLDNTVVQPDMVVVCDKEKMMKNGYVGGPDMAIEISSPSTTRKDRNLKFNKYYQAGVKEYWIVDPNDKTLAVHILRDGDYITKAYTDEDTVSVHILEGCRIDMSEVFA